jgi:NADPH:quinone reductase-like Zn-dependent oxidoreductase
MAATWKWLPLPALRDNIARKSVAGLGAGANVWRGRTLKAVLLRDFGGLDMLDYREDVPMPCPRAGEVLLRVGACGLNNSDIWTREGAYGLETDSSARSGWLREPMRFPLIQGGDIVGRIVDVGAGLPRGRIGERVLVDDVMYSGEGDGIIDSGCIGSECDGGFAEYVCVLAGNAHPIDCALTDEELATFPIAYQSAEHMLNRGRVSAGETVVIPGASGGVGSALVQLAHARGARTVAITSRRKLGDLRSLGAEICIAREEPDLPAAVAKALDGRPVDVVADIVGGSMFADLLRVLRPMGRHVIAGAIAGPMAEVDLRTIYLKHLEIIGASQGTREEFRVVLDHIQSGRVKPLVAAVYPLREMRQAQAYFAGKDFVGKIVIVPDC